MPTTTFLDGRSYTQLKGIAWLTMREIGHTVKGTVVSDSGGGGTTVWTAGTADIPCRVDLVGGSEILTEERIANVSTYVIMVPGDVDIEPADRFAVDGRGTFLVTQHHATAPANAGQVYRRAGGEVRAFAAVAI